jgi:hypothetical protein
MEKVGIFLAILYFYGHLVNFVVAWYIFQRFGMLCQDISGSSG